MAEIQADPARYGYFLAIRQAGRRGPRPVRRRHVLLARRALPYVSRPSFADVVAFDLRTRKIVWRVAGRGQPRRPHGDLARRHAGCSSRPRPRARSHVHRHRDRHGSSAASSPATSRTRTTSPRDGKLIYHASHRHRSSRRTDDPLLDATKGDRWFEIVDAQTLQVLKRLDMGQKLAEAGYPNMSSAVRPMALSPDERTVYFQVSFFHGFVEYDLVHDKVLRLAQLPLSEEAPKKRREEYLLDSAHHGLAMNPQGTKLCVAGHDVRLRRDRRPRRRSPTSSPRVGQKPYWATNSGDGRYCFVSFSGDDRVSVDLLRDRARGREHPRRRPPAADADGRAGRAARSASAARARPGAAGRPAPQAARQRPPAARARRAAGAPAGAGDGKRGGRRVAVRGARVRVAGVSARTGRRGRAVLRKRRGFERVRRYRVRASRKGYRTGSRVCGRRAGRLAPWA